MAACPPPGEAIYISANQHGCEVARCDYITCLDQVEPRLRPLAVPIATPRDFGEIRIHRQRVNQSGMMGAYLAWVMGCSPILLCGMDCWVGGTYESDQRAKSSGARVPLEQHLKRWRLAGALMQGADVRSLGGPLVDAGVFPLHDASRPAGPIAEASALYTEVGGIVVEFLARTALGRYEHLAGDVGEISEQEIGKLRARKQIRIIGEIKNNAALRHRTQPARRRK